MAILDLHAKISREFKDDELFKQIAAFKDLLACGHWLLASPGVILVIVSAICIWKRCYGSRTATTMTVRSNMTNHAPSAPPLPLVFQRAATPVRFTIN
jgi:hypothetical protein